MSRPPRRAKRFVHVLAVPPDSGGAPVILLPARSEEHTSELQSQSNLVCRLLLEKEKLRTPNSRLAHSASRHSRPHQPPAERRWRRLPSPLRRPEPSHLHQQSCTCSRLC